MRSRSGLTLHIIFLVALCGAIYFPYLGNTPFFDKGEPREALAVQDIVQRGRVVISVETSDGDTVKAALVPLVGGAGQ
jgi:hypothetical protein